MHFKWRSRLDVGVSRLELLARRGDVTGLIELASAGSSKLSAAAFSRLIEMDPREIAPEVRAALRHRADPVRCAAIRILGQWGDATALAQAVFWLPPRGASRRMALTVIAQLRQPKSAPVLAGSLVAGKAHEGLREEEMGLVLALCQSGGNPAALGRVIDVLTEAFEVDDDQIAHRAEDFLVWLGEDAVPAVSALAQSSAAPERAVWVLGQIGGASVIEPLSEALEHSDARTREQACVALGDLSDPVSVEALMHATRDLDHGVRVAAASALDCIGTAAVLAALSASMSGSNGSSRATPNGAADKKSRGGHKPRSGSHLEAKGA